MFTTVRQQHDDILWEPGHNCFKHFKCIKFVSDMKKNSKVYQKIQYQHLISNKNFIRRKKNLGTILLRTTFDFNRQPIGWFTGSRLADLLYWDLIIDYFSSKSINFLKPTSTNNVALNIFYTMSVRYNLQ